MFDASEYQITVVELPSFERAIKGLLSPEEADGLIAFISRHPDEGAVIPESGGIRKLRWAARGRGKRGGARIIYYFRDLNMPVYLLTAFGKGERIDLSKADLRRMRQMVDQLVRQQWSRSVDPKVAAIMRPIA